MFCQGNIGERTAAAPPVTAPSLAYYMYSGVRVCASGKPWSRGRGGEGFGAEESDAKGRQDQDRSLRERVVERLCLCMCED